MFTKNTQIILPKLGDMSKINYIIYRPDTCNLQIKIVLYKNQEKLLKQEDAN